MRRLTWLIGLLGLASMVHAWMFEQGSLTFTTDTKQIQVSSITTSPTQILTRDSYINRTWIINDTSFTVILSSFNGGMNSNTSFALPGCPTSQQNCPAWSPDGPTTPYWGPMWAVILGTSSTNNTLSVFRAK